MIADCHSVKPERIKLAGLAAGGAKWVPKRVRQINRSQRIHHNAHRRAALLRPNQRLQELYSKLCRLVDINLQPNRVLGPVDGLEHGRKYLPPGTQPSTARTSL